MITIKIVNYFDLAAKKVGTTKATVAPFVCVDLEGRVKDEVIKKLKVALADAGVEAIIDRE